MSISDEISRIQSNIAAAYVICDSKGAALPQTQNSANLAPTIASVSGSANLLWHQCPEKVRAYLDHMEQEPYTDNAVYERSDILTYATDNPADRANTKPIGKTIGSVTYYDYVPNVAEPYSASGQSGTLTFVDKLRWINTTYQYHSSYPRGTNTRDIGGWSCGTGSDSQPCTVKYGMIIRGSEPNAADRELMVNKLGIKSELQLLPTNEQASDRSMKSVWGIDWYGNDTTSSVYGIDNTAVNKYLWKKYLGAVFDSTAKGKPIYVHCGIGADRTGVVMVMLEAILGMSENEIAQDYELTNFAYNQDSTTPRRRNTDAYKAYINAIKSVSLVGGLSDTFNNHAISVALSLGFTADEINAYRNACTNGNPVQINPTMTSCTVSTYNTTDAVPSPSPVTTTVDQYQGYEAEIIPASGCMIDSVTVMMNGVDITADVFKGELLEPTGTLAINANGKTDVSFYKNVNVNVSPNVATKSISVNGTYNASSDGVDGYSQVVVNVPTVSPSGTKQIIDTSLTDVTNYANAQVVDADLVAGNIKKDVSILGITGTYEGSGSSVNCKIFTFTSAAAVANQDVTVVSGDADVAAHYADANAMATVRKISGNTSNGLAFIMGSNHLFGNTGAAYGAYMNYNTAASNAGATTIPLNTSATTSEICVRATSSGDIIVHCKSQANNFGGADYIIIFTW